jgi:hypothetical protein
MERCAFCDCYRHRRSIILVFCTAACANRLKGRFAVAWVLLEVGLIWFLPSVFMRFGIVVAGAVSLAATVAGVVLGSYGAVSFFVVAALAIGAYYLLYERGCACATAMLSSAFASFTSLPLFIVLVIGLSLSAIVAVLAALIVYYAVSLSASHI